VKTIRCQIQLLAWLALGAAATGCAALPPAAWSPDNPSDASLAFANPAATAPLDQINQNRIVRGQTGGVSSGGYSPYATPGAPQVNPTTPGSNQHLRYPLPASGVGAGPAPQYYNGAVFGGPPAGYGPATGVAPPPAVVVAPLPPPQSGGVMLAPGDVPYVPESVLPPTGVLAPP
jgi:hypothetical protein